MITKSVQKIELFPKDKTCKAKVYYKPFSGSTRILVAEVTLKKTCNSDDDGYERVPITSWMYEVQQLLAPNLKGTIDFKMYTNIPEKDEQDFVKLSKVGRFGLVSMRGYKIFWMADSVRK